jgi:hypothetical protein
MLLGRGCAPRQPHLWSHFPRARGDVLLALCFLPSWETLAFRLSTRLPTSKSLLSTLVSCRTAIFVLGMLREGSPLFEAPRRGRALPLWPRRLPPRKVVRSAARKVSNFHRDNRLVPYVIGMESLLWSFVVFSVPPSSRGPTIMTWGARCLRVANVNDCFCMLCRPGPCGGDLRASLGTRYLLP